ncbi:MAG: hypothetical protein ACOWWO_00585 [Peptococcaceae bacterium]
MSENIQHELKREINVFCTEVLEKLTQNYPGSYQELIDRWLELHNIYLETLAAGLQQWIDNYAGSAEPMDKIEADAVVIEIADKNTGKVFRRSLPVQYLETDNGVMLSGETIAGVPSQIAFFSDAAVSRMHDITGRGPDSHRCQET